MKFTAPIILTTIIGYSAVHIFKSSGKQALTMLSCARLYVPDLRGSRLDNAPYDCMRLYKVIAATAWYESPKPSYDAELESRESTNHTLLIRKIASLADGARDI